KPSSSNKSLILHLPVEPAGAFRSHNFYDFFHKKIELLEIMSNFGISMDHVGKCRLIGHTQ
ncbi:MULTISPECIES: hypothetical protein, partial [Muribaculaceae]